MKWKISIHQSIFLFFKYKLQRGRGRGREGCETVLEKSVKIEIGERQGLST